MTPKTTTYEKFKQYKNYGIIAVVSLICLFFFPLIGSTVGLAFVFPNTAAGWLVFIVSKILVASVNLLILYCFVNQGKFNVRNHESYLRAASLLFELSHEEAEIPRSPKEHYQSVYGKKGVSLFVTSAIASISLTQAVLAFDLITFFTYLITITMGIIFGIIQMGAEEIYWTEEYLQHALYRTNRAHSTTQANQTPSAQSTQKGEQINNDSLHHSST